MEIWEPPAVQDLPGCAIFGGQPFCEQGDVLHGTLRSQTLAEQSKQQELRKNGSKDPPATLPVSFGLISNKM